MATKPLVARGSSMSPSASAASTRDSLSCERSCGSRASTALGSSIAPRAQMAACLRPGFWVLRASLSAGIALGLLDLKQGPATCGQSARSRAGLDQWIERAHLAAPDPATRLPQFPSSFIASRSIRSDSGFRFYPQSAAGGAGRDSGRPCRPSARTAWIVKSAKQILNSW